MKDFLRRFRFLCLCALTVILISLVVFCGSPQKSLLKIPALSEERYYSLCDSGLRIKVENLGRVFVGERNEPSYLVSDLRV